MLKIPVIGAIQQSQQTNAGEAKLFIPLQKYVEVSESGSSDKDVQDFIDSIVPQLKKLNIVPSNKMSIRTPYSIAYPSVQKSVLVAVCASVLGRENKKNLHSAVYELEKDMFGVQANAQTVAAVYNEIFFFRKEFEFYRTMVKLPMKFPEEFLAVMHVEETSDVKQAEDVEKLIRRLVYSISTENLVLFKEVVGDGIIVDEAEGKQLTLTI